MISKIHKWRFPMNDKLNLEPRHATEAIEEQSDMQASERQPWTTPSLTVVDINQETENGPGGTSDGAGSPQS